MIGERLILSVEITIFYSRTSFLRNVLLRKNVCAQMDAKAYSFLKHKQKTGFLF